MSRPVVDCVMRRQPDRLSSSDNAAVQDSGVVRPTTGDDAVGVVAHNVIPRLGDEVAIGVDIVPVNIAAEDGLVGLPVTFVAVVFAAGKATVERYTVIQDDSVGAVRTWMVSAGLEPNLITGDSLGQGGLQSAGVCPRGAISTSPCRWRGVEEARVGAGVVWRQEPQCDHRPYQQEDKHCRRRGRWWQSFAGWRELLPLAV